MSSLWWPRSAFGKLCGPDGIIRPITSVLAGVVQIWMVPLLVGVRRCVKGRRWSISMSLFTSGGRMESEQQVDLSWLVVVKRELSHNATLSINRSIYVPTLTTLMNCRYSLKEDNNKWLKLVSSTTLTDSPWEIKWWQGLRVELLLLQIEMSWFRRFTYQVRTQDTSISWLGNSSLFPLEEPEEVEVWAFCLSCIVFHVDV